MCNSSASSRLSQLPISIISRAKVMEMIEMGNWESLDDADELHIAKAERENLAIKQGQMMIPADFDDGVLHIFRHNLFRLTVEYEELVAQYPVIQQMFADHIQIHVLGLQEIAMRQQQAAMAAQPQQMAS